MNKESFETLYDDGVLFWTFEKFSSYARPASIEGHLLVAWEEGIIYKQLEWKTL